jgi:hypothetical protein
MLQQFSFTWSTLCTSNLREYVGLIVCPKMFFFLKSFLENKKVRENGTQNEEVRKVKKSSEMFWTSYFLALRLHECEGGVK